MDVTVRRRVFGMATSGTPLMILMVSSATVEGYSSPQTTLLDVE